MKNNKSLLFDIISFIVMIVIVGMIVALAMGIVKDAKGMFNGSFDMINNESDTKVSNNSSGLIDTDDGIYTYADGDIQIGLRNMGSYNLLVITCDKLKANTDYNITWQFDSDYKSQGFDILYKESNNQQFPCVFLNFTKGNSPEYTELISLKESAILTKTDYFTTNTNKYVEYGIFSAEISNDATVIQSQLAAFEEIIKSITITEYVPSEGD